MADSSIGSLPSIESMQTSDLFVLEQNGTAKRMSGAQLAAYIDRQIVSVSVVERASTASYTASYNADTGALVLGIPRGVGIQSVLPVGDQPAGEPTLQRTYRVLLENGNYNDIIFFDGRDGAGLVNKVDGVSPVGSELNVPLGAMRLNASVGLAALSNIDINDLNAGVALVNGATCTNSPYSSYIMLVCCGTGNRRIQVAIDWTNARPPMIRYCSSGTWQSWTYIVTSRKVSITIPSSGWTDSGSGYYTKSITISGSTNNSKVDLQPSATQILQLIDDGVTALYVENDNGLRLCAVGEPPTTSMQMQATITEVSQ